MTATGAVTLAQGRPVEAGPPGAGASLSDWLDWQLARHGEAIRLGLERVSAVAERLGLRPARIPTITIGGTNGKGAASALAGAALREAGYRVGVYTSPHLHRYNERVAVDGEPVADAELVSAFEAIEAVRDGVPLTFFEVGTLAALQVFRARNCTVQVLEVGLGGRLDAVNLLDADAALITSIGLDHTDWLGPTRSHVAREKGGIYRPGRVAVCTDAEPPGDWLAELSAQGIRPLRWGDPLRLESDPDGWTLHGPAGERRYPYPTQLPGAHQLRNAAGVFAVFDALSPRLEVPQTAREAALAAWCLPGRWERHGRVVLDVAHNREAVEALVPLIAKLPQPVNLVLGMLADKPVEAVAETLAPFVARAHLLDLGPPRGLSAAELAGRIGHRLPVTALHGRADAALTAAAQGPGSVLVCGSFKTVEAVRSALLAGVAHV